MSKQFVENDERLASLNYRIRLYRILVFIFLAVALLLLGIILSHVLYDRGNFLKVQNLDESSTAEVKKSRPYGKEIEKIIEALEYSGVEVLLGGRNVNLSIDPYNREWTLHDIRHFDADGNILLTDGKYGTCGELAAYVYRQVYPLLSKKYDIRFVRTSQSGFFLGDRASHIVLVIRPKGGAGDEYEEPYIIDPSFRRYGPKSEFEEYLFFEEMDSPLFLKEKIEFVTAPINVTIPLLIRRDRLLSFLVEGVSGKFDSDNYIVAVTNTKKNRFASRYLFAFRRENGNESVFVAESSTHNTLLSPKEYQALYDKVYSLFKEVKIISQMERRFFYLESSDRPSKTE